jgi:hypothetical protein
MELGAIGELVAGVAVIESLIFVGLQLRHNTRAVESTTHHQMLDYTRGAASLVVADPEVPKAAEGN